MGHLVGAVFGDAAFAELFHRLFCSEDWQGGRATASILATLGDYFDDFERCLEPSWFKRCAPCRRWLNASPGEVVLRLASFSVTHVMMVWCPHVSVELSWVCVSN